MDSDLDSLKCPKCQGNLQPVIYQSIEVDRCSNCGGIWFDSREAEILKKIRGSEQLDTGNPERGDELDRIERDINCPRCHSSMIRMLDVDRYSIWYEKCSTCGGVWLDAGEFKKFKRNFQPNNVWQAIRQFFRR